jgi:GNAT superfamily N-acetyltransferase
MNLDIANETCLASIAALASECITHMRRLGIEQWDELYPTIDTFRQDCAGGHLLVLRDDKGVIGSATLDDHQPSEYRAIHWEFLAGPVGVVHRLMIAPPCMGKGLAKLLMAGVEEQAYLRGYRVLRLDAFLKNPPALRLYAGLGYRRAGNVDFRKGPIACFEKELRTTTAASKTSNDAV